jgi:radical SAM protein with 4Fe4S-binding SPASM domain
MQQHFGLSFSLIMEISHYCHKKSNELRVEVLPSFVCNGTLLSKTIAEALQKEGILFGVSLDGLQYDNDHHRKGKDYKSVFDEVLKNIVPLSNKKYIGIAGTITKDVIDLDRTITYLSSSFSTISFRPVRSEIFGLDEKSEFLWEREYDHLATHLITDLLSGNLKLFYCLMNGEDFFGRFLCREFGEMRTINRCDAGITRFACNLDGSIYPCPSCSCIPSMKMGNALSKEAQKNLVAQAIQCKECRWKMICGGECQIEYLRKNKTNEKEEQ